MEELNPPAYNPQIQIRGRLNGTMFHFEIEDNGLGIKKENINRVLDPMFTTEIKSRWNRPGNNRYVAVYSEAGWYD